MSDTFTPNINLTKPEVGSSRDAWGEKWNENADTIDDTVKAIYDRIIIEVGKIESVPAGTIAWYAGLNVPSGWLKCNGATLSQAAYPKLLNAIGGLYGNGPGTFNLPDIRGAFIRGLDEGRGYDPNRNMGPFIQLSQNLRHRHELTGGGFVMQLYGSSGPNVTLATGNEQVNPGVHAVNIAVDGGDEARPTNIAFPAIIKY